jgi:hypothetical protein
MSKPTLGTWEIIDVDARFVKIHCPHPSGRGIQSLGYFRKEDLMPIVHLIVTAVNSCQEVNPENPLAVAQRIKRTFEERDKLYEALIAVYQDIELQNVEGGSDELNIMVGNALALCEKGE